MTESVHLYLRVKKKNGPSIPALSILVGVFSNRYGVEQFDDVHQQVTSVITELVGANRITMDGHLWWRIEEVKEELKSFLDILVDLDAYSVIVEDRE